MKRILLIEDEKPAANRLTQLVKALSEDITIVAVLDSVEDSVEWLNANAEPDLAFFDIQLADGLSFSILEQVPLNCPIIFTTAYDEYALKAFKVNSIDYLLKPIDPRELQRAWQKFLKLQAPQTDFSQLVQGFQQFNQQKNYKERFLIKKGDQFKYLKIEEVAYFYSDEGLTFLINKTGKRYVIDEKLDQLAALLNPNDFFRISRKFIIHESAVDKIHAYLNSRLKLDLSPKCVLDAVVARERVSAFKEWLGS